MNYELKDTWVLFDLDGTLTQSEEGIWNCAKHAAKEMGFPEPDAATLRKFIGPPLLYSFREYLGMTAEQAEQAQAIYRARYTTVGMYENRVYPGVRTMMRILWKAGYKLGIVTGKPAYPTGKILEHFGLDRFLSRVVCASDARAEKADLIREALPEEYGEAWMVGDRCFDMEGGAQAGVHTIGAAYGYGSEQELLETGAEKLAHTPMEIADILCPDAPRPRGAFLTVEGLDGSGKGTQMDRLSDVLDRWGFELVHSREPGGTPIGEKIREILLDKENTGMTAETEALLYAASRAQHVREKILPAVAEGKVILCDRYLDSSVAYQGGGRQLGIDEVLAINAPAVGDAKPDLTVYMEIGHRKALERRCAVSEPDRMEMEADSFHARVEEGYHQLIARDPDRFIVVDAEKSRDEIAEEIQQKVLERLMENET
jgi:dTMP kinase